MRRVVLDWQVVFEKSSTPCLLRLPAKHFPNLISKSQESEDGIPKVSKNIY